METGLNGIGFIYKKQFYYSSQQVGLSVTGLLFVQELAIERLTAIALKASLSNSVSAANNDNSSSSKQSAI